MRGHFFAASTALAVVLIAPAAHATVSEGIQLSSTRLFDHFEGKAATAGNGLSDTFTLSLDEASVFTSAFLHSIASPTGDLDFVSVNFDGVHFFDLVNGFFSDASIALVPLAAGDHTLNVTYNSTKAGVTYSGDISIVPVPEPATWGLMLIGIGAVGVTMRHRMQRAKVSFG